MRKTVSSVYSTDRTHYTVVFFSENPDEFCQDYGLSYKNWREETSPLMEGGSFAKAGKILENICTSPYELSFFAGEFWTNLISETLGKFKAEIGTFFWSLLRHTRLAI